MRVGAVHSAALTADGRVYTWGLNGVHQLRGSVALGAAVNRPIAVPLSAPILDLACGDLHCLALAGDGRVFAWGGNFQGQVGNGNTSDFVATPVEVTGPHWSRRVLGIAAGGSHSLAYDLAGNVWAWGQNTSGQLGDTSASIVLRGLPVQVPGVNLLPGL